MLPPLFGFPWEQDPASEGRVFLVRVREGRWEVMLQDEWKKLPLNDRATLEEVTDHVAMFRRPPFTVRLVS